MGNSLQISYYITKFDGTPQDVSGPGFQMERAFVSLAVKIEIDGLGAETSTSVVVLRYLGTSCLVVLRYWRERRYVYMKGRNPTRSAGKR